MRDKLLLLVVLILSIGTVNAQEINCRVVINYDKITNVNTQIFKSLETSINDFINKTVWTEKTFENQEKIRTNSQNNVIKNTTRVVKIKPPNRNITTNIINLEDFTKD